MADMMAQVQMDADGPFSLKVICDKFEACLLEEGDVILPDFLEGFEESIKLLHALGPAFAILVNNVRQKIHYLGLHFQEACTYYNHRTVKLTIEHEFRYAFINRQDFPSCLRTLVPVHRVLDFTRLFLEKASSLEDHDATSAPCRDTYSQILEQDDSFILKNCLKLNMYFLPNRAGLLRKVCINEKSIQLLLSKMLELSATVSSKIQDFYTMHDLCI